MAIDPSLIAWPGTETSIPSVTVKQSGENRRDAYVFEAPIRSPENNTGLPWNAEFSATRLMEDVSEGKPITHPTGRLVLSIKWWVCPNTMRSQPVRSLEGLGFKKIILELGAVRSL